MLRGFLVSPRLFLASPLVLALFATTNVASTARAADADYCYLPSEGRGVGTVPDVCPANTEQDGLLCYPFCDPGYDGVGPVCWEQCPAGLPDFGAVCSDIQTKSSYGRGAGTAVNSCRSGYQKQGGLCYPQCKSGFYGVGPVCWQSCPSGYTDDGAFCRRDAVIVSANNSQCPWYDMCGLTFARGCSTCPSGYINDGCTCRRDAHIFAKASYGRGAGEPMVCSSTQQYDAGLCYPKCKSGYYGVGPVCWQRCPSGYTDDGATCRKDHWKASYARSAGEVRVCSSELEYDAGLCYEPCDEDSTGIGPVCWGVCPDDMIACGAGCAMTPEDCNDVIIEQVFAPLEVLGNLAFTAITFGGGSSALAGVKTAVNLAMEASEKILLKNKLRDELKDAIEDAFKQTQEYQDLCAREDELCKEARDYFTEHSLDVLVDAADDGEVDAETLAALDPTGIASLVLAFNYPICSDVDGDGIGDSHDNCPEDANNDQLDSDLDGVGDLCDNCPNFPNKDQLDTGCGF